MIHQNFKSHSIQSVKGLTTYNFAISILFMLIMTTPCFALKEMRTIPTRDGVNLDFLVRSKGADFGKSVVILFPGGNGAGLFRLEKNGKVRGSNFLVRTSKDFAQEFTSVLIDAPSDKNNGMNDTFRESSEHAVDILKLMDYLTSQGVEKIYLVGTSRGTLSVAALATRIQHPVFKGIVLTSSLDYSKFLKWLPLNNIKVPVLIVHHSEDSCKICNLYEAKWTRDAISKFTSVDFIEVTGGDEPKSDPCEPLSPHGFFGIEEKTVNLIIDWIKKH